MSWLLSFVVAFLTGIFGLFITGGLASLLVEWYHVSSFEGGAGYFVVFLALFGGMLGSILGLVVSRVVAARPRPRFLKALGGSIGAALLIAATVGAGARLLADVPPEIDGQSLFLNIELRWPEGQAPDEAMLRQAGYTTLGALSGSTVRAMEDGPLFTERASRIDNHWVMPGEVRLFTNRGRRLIFFRIGETQLPAFDVPLRGTPGESSRHWSEWLPTNANAAIDKGFRYRYRVRRAGDVLWSDRVGPFSVDVRPAGYFRVGGSGSFAADSSFSIRFNDAPLTELEPLTQVAVLPGPDPALLVTSTAGVCRTVSVNGGGAEIKEIGGCGTLSDAGPMTADQARFEAARSTRAAPGWLDTTTFDQPGLYVLHQLAFDTRTRTAQPFTHLAEFPPYGSEPPLSLSPDEQSFVLLATDREGDLPALLVINRQTGDRYAWPIDLKRMRHADVKEIGPSWIDHHFVWTPGASGDRLEERTGFTPLPHHGWLELAKKGAFQSYRLRPGGQPLREAIIRALVDGGARLTTTDPNSYQQTVVVDGDSFDLTAGEQPSYVMVSMGRSDGDPDAMRAMAARIDAILATGQFDALFVEPPAAP